MLEDLFRQTLPSAPIPTSTPTLDRKRKIIGGTLGAVVLLAFIGGFNYYIHRKTRSKGDETDGSKRPELSSKRDEIELQGRPKEKIELAVTDCNSTSTALVSTLLQSPGHPVAAGSVSLCEVDRGGGELDSSIRMGNKRPHSA